MINISKIKTRIKKQQTPVTRCIYQWIMWWRFFSLPAPRVIFTPILVIHLLIQNLLRRFVVFFYFQPLFEQYLFKKPKYLRIVRNLPYIQGNPIIKIGEHCTLSGAMCIIARTNPLSRSELIIGERVFIGFNTQFYIGNTMTIGDDCKIAEDCILRSYSGHPLDPVARQANRPDEEDKVKDIVLENNVWLCQGVSVNPGVRIGENSVIASGSIVTKNIPPNVLAGGIPATIIMPL